VLDSDNILLERYFTARVTFAHSWSIFIERDRTEKYFHVQLRNNTKTNMQGTDVPIIHQYIERCVLSFCSISCCILKCEMVNTRWSRFWSFSIFWLIGVEDRMFWECKILIFPKSNHFCSNFASILPKFRLNFAQKNFAKRCSPSFYGTVSAYHWVDGRDDISTRGDKKLVKLVNDRWEAE